MGVWIETTAAPTNISYNNMSHPVWVCGLKQFVRPLCDDLTEVTPCMGVWIETAAACFNASLTLSHPVWVCGLKPLSNMVRSQQTCHTLYGCVD